MARVTSFSLVDDLTGGKAAETVTFSLDGKEMEIDLNEEHAAQLRDVLAPYVGAGREASGRQSSTRVPSRPRASSKDRGQNARIRAWAAEQGMQIADRGRIPAEIAQAYAARSTAPSSGSASSRSPRAATTTVAQPQFTEPEMPEPTAEKPVRRVRKKVDASA
ncbi:hypothetical protein GCM10009836_04300 [Pseudonocardia ailaonensis]|uniref:Nucleoid-associated protein Lsr2 n=2 Tax=Pseudonocardia ailaonensis TaxID=367279 RepID=A0ABN2MJK1_9PSEU